MARTARFSGKVDLWIFAACAVLALVATTLPERMRDPVAGGMRRSLVAPLVNLQAGAERWRAAWVNADRITGQRDSLAQQAYSAVALQSENDRLRKLLGLGSQLKWGFVPAEALHVGTGAEKYTLTLTAGGNAGVRRGAPVVAPEGLVGMVQTVDPTMSLAITFSHPDFRVSAMSADGKVFGIVQPHLEGTGTDANGGNGAETTERYMLEMRGVPFRDSLKVGTRIYSSGVGGIYPRGVPVGSVTRELKVAEGSGFVRTYLIRPAVNPAEITSVMILAPQRQPEDFGGVWSRGGGLDSATRGIVAAGDSLTRQEALAEAAAQRAALDSTLRAKIDSVRRIDSTRADSMRAVPPGGVPQTVPGAAPVTPRPNAPAPAAPRPTTTTTTPATTPRERE